MSNVQIIILENEYFKFYTIDNNIHLDSQPPEIQEKYDSNEVMTHEVKLKKLDELMEYFYNFWKLIEKTNEDTNNYTMSNLYTLNFNVNLVMFHVPMEYYIKFKKVFESLNTVFKNHLKETYIKIENKLAKHFFDLILTFYKPVKPVHTISN